MGVVNNKAPWEEMYQRLVAYKKEYKHSNVPQRYKGEQQLGTWVSNQRNAYRKKEIAEEFKLKLDSIHFVWNIFS